MAYMLSFLQENLSRRPTAVLTQSSTFETSIASKANDGKVELDLYTACAHTALNRRKAWLQVDLGQSYRINNVKIYYRNQGMNCIDCFKNVLLTLF